MKALEELRIEKRAQKDKYEVDLAGMEKRLRELKDSSKTDQRSLAERLKAEHAQALEKARAEEQDKINSLEQVSNALGIQTVKYVPFTKTPVPVGNIHPPH